MPKVNKRGHSLDEFKSSHDRAHITEKRIKDALKELGDAWEYEIEFARRAHVSLREMPALGGQFEHHLVMVKNAANKPRRIWCGTVKFANQLRKQLPK